MGATHDHLSSENDTAAQVAAESVTHVDVEVRQNFGARRLRAIGKVPAVIYGHGTDPVHVALPDFQISLLIRRANALFEIELDGKEALTLVKDVKRDPVHEIVERIDLLVVRKGEKVSVDVPIVVVGKSAAGTIANVLAQTVALEVEATHIPEQIDVNVDGLEEGTHITAADLALPGGASPVADADLVVIATPEAGPDVVAGIPERVRALIPVLGEDRLSHLLNIRLDWLDQTAVGADRQAELDASLSDLEAVLSLVKRHWGEAARDWLLGPNSVLEGARPVDVLEVSGANDVIRAIELSAA